MSGTRNGGGETAPRDRGAVTAEGTCATGDVGRGGGGDAARAVAVVDPATLVILMGVSSLSTIAAQVPRAGIVPAASVSNGQLEGVRDGRLAGAGV